MKIFFDMNNLGMRLIHLPMIEAASENPKWDFWKYLMFSNIYEFITQESESDPLVEVILACDNKTKSWRAQVYAPYKANRVKDQTINWEMVFTHFEMFLEDIKTYLPWKVMKVEGCEADDVIAILCKNREPGEHCVIHSGDSDYLQLECTDIDVYAPHKDSYVTFPCTVKIAGSPVRCQNADEFLLLSVLTGQGCKDNVYNVKTDTDWVPTEDAKRKPGFGVKAAQKVIAGGLEASLEKLGFSQNFHRNQMLIDFKCIPAEIEALIMSEYASYPIQKPRTGEFLERYTWRSLQAQSADIEDVVSILAGWGPVDDRFFEDTYLEDESDTVEEDFIF